LPASNPTHPEPPSRLLVVDDDFHNRLSLSRRLERRGYRVDTAEGGAEALDKLLGEHYDLVLLDQMMPEMSGIDLLRLLRATHSQTDLPVIMVTALDENEMMAQALEEGANDYVVKPVELPEITARIQTQLARSKTKRKDGQLEPTRARLREASWEWDVETGKARYSAEWGRLVGRPSTEISSTWEEWLDRIHPEDLVRVRKELKLHLDGAAPEFRSEHRLRCGSGQYRWVLSRAEAFRGEDGKVLRLCGSTADMEDRKVDALTGLANRVQFLERLDASLRQDRTTWAVVLLDLDEFALLNEHRGHEMADQVLVEVGSRLRGAVQESSFDAEPLLARVGGDEFGLLVACGAGMAGIRAIAEKLLAALKEPVRVGGEPFTVTASVGASLSAAGLSSDQILREAGLALRKARDHGGRCWKLYESGFRDRAHIRATLARDLRYVIERNQLVAVYQPKVELRTGAIAGFEALLRWRHPELGLVAPMDFIPMAEETGVILAAGEWILRAACRQLKAWQELTGSRLQMSVNLSARQLSDPNLNAIVERALADARIDACCLALELTESSLIEEKQAAQTALSQLHDLGIQLMLDDFGTGYASLSYLSMLRFDVLKIDRSFVAKIDSATGGGTIIRTILSLARELHMDVVAEGIETEEQARLLVEMGCEKGQGYYYSKPVDARDVPALLQKCFAPLPSAEVRVA
jgi:diguanylate cyclase (GGDEF)-like protein